MKNLFKRNTVVQGTSTELMPKGIHHTVSYAVSYNDTWNHIRNEIRKMTINRPQ